MSTTRRVAMTLWLVAVPALAQRPADLERAQELVGERKYDKALRALDALKKRAGLDRETLLTTLELRGLAEASLGRTDAAEAAFRELLTLDPRREVTGKYQGRVAAAASAAVTWLSANGALEVGPLEPGVENGRVRQVSLQVKSDVLKLVRTVRFHVRGSGGVWKPTDIALANGSAATDVDGEAVDWWAELLGERSAQLAFVGSAGRPIHTVAPAPKPVVAEAPKAAPPSDAPKRAPDLTPKPASEPVTLLAQDAPSHTSTMRYVGYALLGTGAVAGGVGAAFGLSSRNARTGIRKDVNAGASTQVELYARDQNAIRDANIANALFVTAGALGLTGGALWFFGRDVQISPGAGGGIVLSGSLP